MLPKRVEFYPLRIIVYFLWVYNVLRLYTKHTSASAPLRMHIPEHRSTLHEVYDFIQEVNRRENLFG